MPKCFKCGEPSNVSRDGVYFCDFHNRKQDEEEKKRLNKFKFLNSIIDNTYKIVIIIIVLISIFVVLPLILPFSFDIPFLSNDLLESQQKITPEKANWIREIKNESLREQMKPTSGDKISFDHGGKHNDLNA